MTLDFGSSPQSSYAGQRGVRKLHSYVAPCWSWASTGRHDVLDGRVSVRAPCIPSLSIDCGTGRWVPITRGAHAAGRGATISYEALKKRRLC
jgi:hypothetical protein